MAIVLVLGVLLLAVILLVLWIARLQRKSRAIEKTLDYSKMRDWDDS